MLTRSMVIALGVTLSLGLLGVWWFGLGTPDTPEPVVSPAVAPTAPQRVGLDQQTASAPLRTAPHPPWRLLGTVVNAADARSSMAWVSIDGGEPRMLRLGEGLSDSQVLLAIDAQSIRVGHRDGTHAVELPLRPLAAPLLATRPQPPEIEVSPIVPPYAEMVAPPAEMSGTPDSLWAARRAASSP